MNFGRFSRCPRVEPLVIPRYFPLRMAFLFLSETTGWIAFAFGANTDVLGSQSFYVVT